MSIKEPVYNLQFPSWCPGFTLFGYEFARADDYQDQVRLLQHLGTIHSEYTIEANTGTHAITAYVIRPDHEEMPALDWQGSNCTALDDVLLLLSIFTQRDLFVLGPEASEPHTGVIIADHRKYRGGGILRCSIPYKSHPVQPEPHRYDIGFEQELNRIYALIRNQDWRHKHGHGVLLVSSPNGI